MDAEVRINDTPYVPRNTVIPDRALRLLKEVYAGLWMEAYYDPTNESTRKFAEPLADKMVELNSILHFKK